MASDSERGRQKVEKADGAISDEAVRDAAEAMRKQLWAQLGRAPTLAEVQAAMVELSTIVWRQFYEDEGAVNLGTAAGVKASHDDTDTSRKLRDPKP